MENRGFIRGAGAATVIGALIGLVISIKRAASIPDMAFATSGGIELEEILIVVAFAALLIGTVGLALSGAAGSGRSVKIGFGVALLGLIMASLYEVVLLVQDGPSDSLGILSGLLVGLGMLPVGIAFLQQELWRGWRKSTPLLVGLCPLLMVFAYPLLESSQVLYRGDGQSLDLGLTAFWFLCWIPLGIALWVEASQEQATQPGLAH
jgi:hypothetical protein